MEVIFLLMILCGVFFDFLLIFNKKKIDWGQIISAAFLILTGFFLLIFSFYYIYCQQRVKYLNKFYEKNITANEYFYNRGDIEKRFE